MSPVLIFKDRFGRRWIDRHTLKHLFGIAAYGIPRWWNYDILCRRYWRNRRER